MRFATRHTRCQALSEVNIDALGATELEERKLMECSHELQQLSWTKEKGASIEFQFCTLRDRKFHTGAIFSSPQNCIADDENC
jgi:hypothetical protein